MCFDHHHLISGSTGNSWSMWGTTPLESSDQSQMDPRFLGFEHPGLCKVGGYVAGKSTKQFSTGSSLSPLLVAISMKKAQVTAKFQLVTPALELCLKQL